MGELVDIVDSLENKISKCCTTVRAMHHNEYKLEEELFFCKKISTSN